MGRVTLQGVHKRYGAVTAVSDVSLEIQDQEFVVLVGPSGCGKSTTLRMVAGLEEITGGTIAIGERVVNDLPPKDRDIAMVFQNYALYQHMTVYDNLAFGLRNRKAPESRIRDEIEHAVGILGIGELLGRKPRQLSGGQQQRVALGRCIVRHPQVFLFDEPLSNLDAKLRAQMRIELKRLRERVPTTSIYVTHDQVEAMTLGDRVVVMKDGHVQQVGTPWEIYTRPSSRFVAGFIGSPAMNFVDVAVEGEGDDVWLRQAGMTIPAPAERRAALAAYVGRKVTLGVRPEHVSIADGVPGPVVEGRIDVTEQLGSELQVDVLVGDTPIIVSRIDPERALAPGQPVRLALNPARLHFFDRETEAVIP
ncbi:MAG TPA: sn-glycerol-3-phosphate ABC transporter ATP-binding protein UgpC [Geminicoccaceae bacterium]